TLFITLFSFFFTATAPTDIYTLSLHDALPICILAQIHDLRNRDERRAESGQREGDARAYARAIDELHAGPQQPDQRSVLHVQRTEIDDDAARQRIFGDPLDRRGH